MPALGSAGDHRLDVVGVGAEVRGTLVIFAPETFAAARMPASYDGIAGDEARGGRGEGEGGEVEGFRGAGVDGDVLLFEAVLLGEGGGELWRSRRRCRNGRPCERWLRWLRMPLYMGRGGFLVGVDEDSAFGEGHAHAATLAWSLRRRAGAAVCIAAWAKWASVKMGMAAAATPARTHEGNGGETAGVSWSGFIFGAPFDLLVLSEIGTSGIERRMLKQNLRRLYRTIGTGRSAKSLEAKIVGG